MGNNFDSLDNFLSQGGSTSNQIEEKKVDGELEDEFAALLSNFLGSNNKKPSKTQAKPKINENNGEEKSLDDFLVNQSDKYISTIPSNVVSTSLLDEVGMKSSQSSTSLSDFETTKRQEVNSSVSGLNSFQTQNNDSGVSGLNSFQTQDSGSKLDDLSSFQTQSNSNSQLDAYKNSVEQEISLLKTEEKELSRAINNFYESIEALCEKHNFAKIKLEYEAKMLSPNYKPSVGKKIANYLMQCWDIIVKSDPDKMQHLSKNATDNDLLVFAEGLDDSDMMLAVISYLEIIINMEICEVNYEQKREIMQKNRIKKELYDEYMNLQKRKQTFLDVLKSQHFPIDVDRLMNNYFKVAQKDPDGSYAALTKNPAMFSPIDFSKIKPRFFGLIKVAPVDGVRFNQKIGEFIKKIKA